MSTQKKTGVLILLSAILLIGLLAACGRADDAAQIEQEALTAIEQSRVNTGAKIGKDATNLQDDGVPLEGTLWVLESFATPEGETVSALPGTRATATLQDGQIGGTTGCNNFGGTYEVDGNSLTVQLGPMTMMACPEPIMAQETAYMAALGSAATYEITGEQLMIADEAGDVVLTFGVDQPVPLVGTLWQLGSFNTGTGMLSSLTTELITATFDEGNNLFGFAGCNDYRAFYQVEDDSIMIGPAVTTRRACAEPEDAMETEAAYLGALPKAATFTIEGQELTLFDEEGTRVAVYRTAEAMAEPDVDAAAVAPSPAEPTIEEAQPSVAGSYGAMLPAADSPGRDIVLALDEDGTATLTTDFMNDQPPIVEVGTWEMAEDGLVTVTLTGQADREPYDEPVVIGFEVQEDQLVAVDYDEALYGSEGLDLTRQEAEATPAEEPTVEPADEEAEPTVIGTYQTMLPSASSAGRHVVLTVLDDGTVTLSTDYLNDEPPIVEIGTWEVDEQGSVTITLTGQGETEPYDEPVVITFVVEDDQFVAVEVDETIYGADELELLRQEALGLALATAERAFVTLDLQAGFALDPFFVSVNGGGAIDASTLGENCTGFIHQEPVVSLDWEGEADFAEVFFYSDHDPTLVIRTPTGEYLCNDDANPLLLDPVIQIDNPAQGVYEIWVGSYHPNQMLPGVLVLTTRPEVNIGTFVLDNLITRQSVPEVLQTAEGRMAAEELFDAIKQRQGEIPKVTLEDEPLQVEVTAEGDVPAFEFELEDMVCNGYIDLIPSYVFELSGVSETMAVYFEGDQDATLILLAPGEQVICGDDAVAGENLNPLLVIPEPTEGLYAVFVGRLNPEAPVTGTLSVASGNIAKPAVLQPATPVDQ